MSARAQKVQQARLHPGLDPSPLNACHPQTSRGVGLRQAIGETMPEVRLISLGYGRQVVLDEGPELGIDEARVGVRCGIGQRERFDLDVGDRQGPTPVLVDAPVPRDAEQVVPVAALAVVPESPRRPERPQEDLLACRLDRIGVVEPRDVDEPVRHGDGESLS